MEHREVDALAIVEDTPFATSETSCVLDAEGHCITCSDEARPARVVRVDERIGLALVEMEDAQELEVDITLVEDVEPGDWLLIYGGVAIGLLEERETGEVSNA